jgi:hypothetical protein
MRPLIVILALAVCIACGGDEGSPTGPTTVDVRTFVFQGTLPVGGMKFYSFTVSTAGTIQAMLASLTNGNAAVAGARVEFSVGIPAGTGCRPLTTATVGAALVPQLVTNLGTGIYCVSITDTGSLRTDTGFAIRVLHP